MRVSDWLTAVALGLLGAALVLFLGTALAGCSHDHGYCPTDTVAWVAPEAAVDSGELEPGEPWDGWTVLESDQSCRRAVVDTSDTAGVHAGVWYVMTAQEPGEPWYWAVEADLGTGLWRPVGWEIPDAESGIGGAW